MGSFWKIFSLELPKGEDYSDYYDTIDPSPPETENWSPTERKRKMNPLKFKPEDDDNLMFFEKGLHQTINTPQSERPMTPYGNLKLSWRVPGVGDEIYNNETGEIGKVLAIGTLFELRDWAFKNLKNEFHYHVSDVIDGMFWPADKQCALVKNSPSYYDILPLEQMEVHKFSWKVYNYEDKLEEVAELTQYITADSGYTFEDGIYTKDLRETWPEFFSLFNINLNYSRKGAFVTFYEIKKSVSENWRKLSWQIQTPEKGDEIEVIYLPDPIAFEINLIGKKGYIYDINKKNAWGGDEHRHSKGAIHIRLYPTKRGIISFGIPLEYWHEYIILTGKKSDFYKQSSLKFSKEEPSDARIEAGNYKKKHIRKDGFDISIENDKGSTRSGTDKDGKEWSVKMKHAYGYIKGTEGKDGDHVDVILADAYKEDQSVFIVNQTDDKGKFDEHKVCIGFISKDDAEKAYLDNYEKGWKNYGDIIEMPMEQFKEWVRDKKYTKNLAKPLKLSWKLPDLQTQIKPGAVFRMKYFGSSVYQYFYIHRLGRVIKNYFKTKFPNNTSADFKDSDLQEYHGIWTDDGLSDLIHRYKLKQFSDLGIFLSDNWMDGMEYLGQIEDVIATNEKNSSLKLSWQVQPDWISVAKPSKIKVGDRVRMPEGIPAGSRSYSFKNSDFTDYTPEKYPNITYEEGYTPPPHRDGGTVPTHHEGTVNIVGGNSISINWDNFPVCLTARGWEWSFAYPIEVLNDDTARFSWQVQPELDFEGMRFAIVEKFYVGYCDQGMDVNDALQEATKDVDMLSDEEVLAHYLVDYGTPLYKQDPDTIFDINNPTKSSLKFSDPLTYTDKSDIDVDKKTFDDRALVFQQVEPLTPEVPKDTMWIEPSEKDFPRPGNELELMHLDTDDNTILQNEVPRKKTIAWQTQEPKIMSSEEYETWRHKGDVDDSAVWLTNIRNGENTWCVNFYHAKGKGGRHIYEGLSYKDARDKGYEFALTNNIPYVLGMFEENHLDRQKLSWQTLRAYAPTPLEPCPEGYSRYTAYLIYPAGHNGEETGTVEEFDIYAIHEYDAKEFAKQYAKENYQDGYTRIDIEHTWGISSSLKLGWQVQEEFERGDAVGFEYQPEGSDATYTAIGTYWGRDDTNTKYPIILEDVYYHSTHILRLGTIRLADNVPLYLIRKTKSSSLKLSWEAGRSVWLGYWAIPGDQDINPSHEQENWTTIVYTVDDDYEKAIKTMKEKFTNYLKIHFPEAYRTGFNFNNGYLWALQSEKLTDLTKILSKEEINNFMNDGIVVVDKKPFPVTVYGGEAIARL